MVGLLNDNSYEDFRTSFAQNLDRMADDMMNDDSLVQRTVLKTELLQKRLQPLPEPGQPQASFAAPPQPFEQPLYPPPEEPLALHLADPAEPEDLLQRFDQSQAASAHETEQARVRLSNSSSSEQSRKLQTPDSEDSRLKDIIGRRQLLMQSIKAPEPQTSHLASVYQRRVAYLEEQNHTLQEENDSLRSRVAGLSRELAELRAAVERLEAERLGPSKPQSEQLQRSEAPELDSLDELNSLLIRLKTENRYLRMECGNRQSLEQELGRTQEDLRRLKTDLGLELKSLQNKLLVAQERADSVLRDYKRSLELEQEKLAKASRYIRMLEAQQQPPPKTPNRPGPTAAAGTRQEGGPVNHSIYLNNYKSERPSSSNHPRWQASEPDASDSVDRISAFFPRPPEQPQSPPGGRKKLSRAILQQQAAPDPDSETRFRPQLTPKRSDLHDQEASSTLRYEEPSEEHRLASNYKLRYESRVEALFQQSARQPGTPASRSPLRHPLDSLSKADSFLADLHRKLTSLDAQKYEGSN